MGFAAEILKRNINQKSDVALIDSNGSRIITWSNLIDNVCRVCAFAHDKNLKGVVPVYMDRGMEAVATLLGLNLAGVGVAPLSVTTPKSRCEAIASQVNNRLWTIDTFNETIECKPAYEYLDSVKTAQPAYIVFTSGSTGIPKGVMLTNEAILDSFKRSNGADYWALNENDRFLQTASLSFVVFVSDCLAPLYAHCPVYILPENARGDNRMIADYVNRFGITSLFMPPQALKTFEAGPSIKTIVTGGDKITNIAPKNYRLVAAYGMSETAGCIFHLDIKEPMTAAMLGRPTEGVQAYVLDENGNESEQGELCVSGQFAYAYLDMKSLSEETFTVNPFSTDSEHKYIIHTRDIVKKLHDGFFQYINRLDNMVKINGQRVEPGEIEVALLTYPGIDEAAVRAFTLEDQRSILCAYYTSKRELDSSNIKMHLESKLPHYMVPNIYLKIDSMPLNTNGKLDRKSLQMPDMRMFLDDYEEPANETERIICAAFAKTLDLDKVGRNDDFFMIGGDSIAALNVVNECRQLNISTGDIFAGRNAKSIAGMVDKDSSAILENLSSNIAKAKLTDSQLGILLDCGFTEKHTRYNIPLHLWFEKQNGVSPEIIKKAADEVIKAHPALYSRIIEENGEFYMMREEFPSCGICEVKHANDDEINNFIHSYVVPISIMKGPLCTVAALIGSKNIHVFFNMSHIISDGSSVSLLVKQFGEFLSACLTANEAKPDAGSNDVECQKYNFTVPAEATNAFSLREIEEKLKTSNEALEAQTYFKNLLSSTEIDSNIIPDHKPAADSKHESKHLYLDIPFDKVKSAVDDTEITENTFFMGVFGYVLAKMTGQNEILFCAAENGRKYGTLDNTVSMLVKTLPVYMKINEEDNSAALLKDLQSQFFATMRHDCIGFAALAEDYNITSQIMFVYQADMLSNYDTGKININVETAELGEAVSNLSFMVLKTNTCYRVNFEYRTDMYEEYTIKRFLDLYNRVIDSWSDSATKEIPLSKTRLISDEDKAFLDAVNEKYADVQTTDNILDLFKNTVAKYPDKTAVIYKKTKYTYAEVDELTDRIAAFIHSKGIGTGDVVSVLIPRNEYIMIATLGVLKSGAAYEPLDPNYPAERLTYMVTDAKSKLLIKDRSLDHILENYTGEIFYTDEITNLHQNKLDIEVPKADDLFVLLYTSGTTGLPKGVMLNHGNLVSFVDAHTQTLKLDNTCIMANYASYGFDAHMADLYPAIANGTTLVIIPDEMRLDLAEVKDYCEAMKVTHLLMTTQVARQFAVQFDKVEHLRCVNCGGEKLVSFNPSLSYEFLNLYGPSECTVCTTGFTLDKYYDNIPIGHPTKNTRVYIADPYGRRVPVGVPGELIICGPQVGAGYLGKAEKTKEVFVQNIYEDAADPYNKCYKSGDIVRFINDGNMEYIGRRDQQVKIRGFRVELEEVEKAIRDYKGITNATVTLMDNNGAKSICAYIVADDKVDINDLNTFIGMSHPSYMIPSVTMQIDQIPLTVNGKVDKKNLPKPEIQLSDVKKPQNELQEKIFNIISEITGNNNFGTDTDIFTAGVSSIGSIRLCTLLADEFNTPVKIRDLKRCDTVEKLETWLCDVLKVADSPIAVDTELLPTTKEISAATVRTAEKSKAENIQAERIVEYGKSHPITKTMEGIFVECITRQDSTVYNIPFMIEIGDRIDIAKLKRAIVSAVEAHPCMKAQLFTDENGNICQHRIIDDVYSEREIAEIRLSEAEINDSLIKPFALTNSKLFEINIIHSDKTYLLVNIHHIIADGTSVGIFIKDIERAYLGEKLEEETFTTFDIADEEKKSRTPEELDNEKGYYSTLLEGLDKDFLPLPDRYPNQPKSSGKLTISQIHADADTVKTFCDSNKIGMNAFFVSAFGFLLAKYTGTEYSVFNTIYNGRNDSRTFNTIAMMVKTLPVVCNIERQNSLELIREMSHQLMDSMSNDLFSYAETAQSFDVKNDVMFIYQGDNFNFDRFCGEDAREIELELSEAKMALSLQVIIKEGKIVYKLEYDPQKFTEKLAKSMIHSYDQVVCAFAGNTKLNEASMLSKEAEAEMEAYNDTDFDYDTQKTIVDHFLHTVAKQPEHTCVVYKDRTYSYGEIGRLTVKLSYYLMQQGIKRGDVVAILINRTENMVITAHAVERTGAAYVGLDPTYPSERLEFMIKDSDAKCIIADRDLLNIVSFFDGNVFCTDEINNLPEPDESDLERFYAMEIHRVTPEDNALVIYSSGTTGVPKGSVLKHKNIVCFYENYRRSFELDSNANIATYASFGFDGGAMDVFCAPMSGATLFIIPDEIRLNLSKLEQFFVKNKITNSFMTTQVGCMFISATKCKTLKHFVVGGEKLIPVLGPEWVCFRNGYGPSETMCYVNLFKIRDTGNLQPIGSVNGNTKEYIIDKYMNRLPYGACGELCISGGQVGSGYLNRQEKTAEVFIANPFSSKAGYEIMYRTGDIVRMLTDGNYDFVGRRDRQVKIRGFRIELSEVEQQIKKYAGVSNAVVKAFDNPTGGKFLAAYIVADGDLNVDDLKDFIGREKPDYMIPAAIIQISSIPLNSNGKVDSSKLPKPQLSINRKGIAPADALEEKLCEIFGSVLSIDKVYADDDFFKIGGSSISAIQAVVRCEQAGYPIVYKNLFANPTPQKLAQLIRNGKEKDINANDLEKEYHHDYSALAYNTLDHLDKIDNLGIGNVLLTGVTGFLGSHIYKELIESTPSNVICIVRSKPDIPSNVRFEMMMTYYFEDWFNDEMWKRTTIIDSDIEDDDMNEKLSEYHFDTIINCAANVKHFAAEDKLIAANFSGVENLVTLAELSHSKLIQISSISVCGESVNGSVPEGYVFKETDLNIGQSLENKYVYSKYLGEQAVIDAVSRGKIKGKVIRLGNLMARFEDSEFQINACSNGMLRLFLGFKKLGCFPIDMMDAPIEFSPIDDVARAVILLSGTPDEFTMFHCKNCNEIHYGYMLKALLDAGYPIDIVDNDIFEEKLRKALENPDNVTELGGLLAYRNSTKSSLTDAANRSGDTAVSEESKSRIKISTSTAFTTKALYRLGFAWPLISMDYLREMVNVLIELDFFDN